MLLQEVNILKLQVVNPQPAGHGGHAHGGQRGGR